MATDTSTSGVAARRFSLRSNGSSSQSDDSHAHLLPASKEVLESDPLSPTLPSLVPNHGKKPASIVRRLLRLLPWVGVALLLGWMSTQWYKRVEFKTDISFLKPGDGEDRELVHDEILPTEPAAVVVKDSKGKAKWTMSLPSTAEFPLRPKVYADLCSQADLLKKKMHPHRGPHAGHPPYYRVDESFMDVEEAEDLGLLPSNKFETSLSTSSNVDNDAIADKDGFCKKTMTFVMETTDAGMGNTLMQLWLAYGLAKKEGRAFFIDDRNWAYGKYTTFFQPTPKPSCLPPADNHRLPCPHHTRHLLISSATQSITFGHAFNEEYQDPRGIKVQRQKWIFDMMRDGYENLFKLSDEDAGYLERRKGKLNEMIRDKGGMEFGIHVRHGDRHPWEFQYQKSYVPLERYIDRAQELVNEAYNSTDDQDAQMASRMIIASDDPEVFTAPEVSFALKAQERIVMASKSHVDAAEGGVKMVDDTVGWEGGFFKDVFWGLGDPSPSNTAMSQHERSEQLEKEGRIEPSELALQLRGFVGRAYLLDLAVTGQTDRIVCTVSSIACRLLAVMMGWEHAIEQEHWVNIDGAFHWSGIRW